LPPTPLAPNTHTVVRRKGVRYIFPTLMRACRVAEPPGRTGPSVVNQMLPLLVGVDDRRTGQNLYFRSVRLTGGAYAPITPGGAASRDPDPDPPVRCAR